METSSPQTVSPRRTRSPWSSADRTALHLLENDHWQVGLLPGVGASVAHGRVRHGGTWHDLLRPTPEASYADPGASASFLLIPWSNRVADGVLRFGESVHRLRINAGDGTALHGTAWEFPWAVEVASGGGLIATFDSGEFCGVNFPWRFSARVGYQLDGPAFVTTLTVRNDDEVPVPVGFGIHPYFQRTLTGPGDAVRLEVPCSQYFELERCLPSGPPVPVEPRVDFRDLRPLGEEFVDDCLTGRDPSRPIRLVYAESGVAVGIDSDELFSNVVVYIPQQQPFFAVEPVTNANDAFSLYTDGVPGSGLLVLAPGEERTGTITMTVSAGA